MGPQSPVQYGARLPIVQWRTVTVFPVADTLDGGSRAGAITWRVTMADRLPVGRIVFVVDTHGSGWVPLLKLTADVVPRRLSSCGECAMPLRTGVSGLRRIPSCAPQRAPINRTETCVINAYERPNFVMELNPVASPSRPPTRGIT